MLAVCWPRLPFDEELTGEQGRCLKVCTLTFIGTRRLSSENRSSISHNCINAHLQNNGLQYCIQCFIFEEQHRVRSSCYIVLDKPYYSVRKTLLRIPTHTQSVTDLLISFAAIGTHTRPKALQQVFFSFKMFMQVMPVKSDSDFGPRMQFELYL